MYVENNTIKAKDLGGGVTRKILSYSKDMMVCELEFEKGAVGAMHSHVHEQIGYVISGKLIYQEEGAEDKELCAGDSYHVAPNVKHGVVALEPVKLLDVFTPMREDFLE